MSSEPPAVRVNYDDLELDDQLALYEGEPFTGVVFSLHPDGRLESEGGYDRGLPDGEQREWYRNGQLLQRSIAVRGRGSNETWSWYPDGRMRSHRRDEGQKPAVLEAWNEDGRPMDYASLGEGSTRAFKADRTA